MSNYGRHVSRRATVQTSSVLGRTDQVRNNAGGFVFKANDWTRLRRFLILGTEGGTYYAGEGKLTRESAEVVERCLGENYVRTLNEIEKVTRENLAHKKDAAILALALAASHTDVNARKCALGMLATVCKTPTQLFTFMGFARELRGRGAGLRRALRKWYANLSDDKLAQYVTKYQGRAGYTHRDVLRIARPPVGRVALRWAVDGVGGFTGYEGSKGRPRAARAPLSASELPPLIAAFEEAKLASPKRLVQLIEEAGLEREHLPTEALTRPEVWEALALRMGLWGLLRNLGNMGKVGMLTPMSANEATIRARLGEAEVMKSKLHPMLFLLAARTYGSGHGVLGKGSWQVCPKVVEALDEAFRVAFGNVEPTGKRIVVGVDVSGSMTAQVSGATGMSCKEGAAALALILAATEPNCLVLGFSDKLQLHGLQFGKRTSLREAQQMVERLPSGGTDCTLPIQYAIQQRIEADAVVIFTDNETWAGEAHVYQSLAQYRQQTGARVGIANVALAVNAWSMNRPEDKDAIDLVGFDASTPAVLNQFVGGMI